MLRKVFLHGKMARRYGKMFELDVSTAAEAVRALRANFPEILKDFRDGTWHVMRGDKRKGVDLGEEDITGLKLGNGDLHFVPAVQGSKRDGMLKVILGVVLVGASFMGGGFMAAPLAGGAGAAGGGLFGGLMGGMGGGNLAMMGAAMILGGISQLLAPEEKEEKDENSFTMNGPGNTESQGSPIPLVYGEVITGGIMVSGGIDIEDIGNTINDGNGKSSGKGSGGGGKK